MSETRAQKIGSPDVGLRFHDRETVSPDSARDELNLAPACRCVPFVKAWGAPPPSSSLPRGCSSPFSAMQPVLAGFGSTFCLGQVHMFLLLDLVRLCPFLAVAVSHEDVSPPPRTEHRVRGLLATSDSPYVRSPTDAHAARTTRAVCMLHYLCSCEEGCSSRPSTEDGVIARVRATSLVVKSPALGCERYSSLARVDV